jgi:hypothetical protein
MAKVRDKEKNKRIIEVGENEIGGEVRWSLILKIRVRKL